ncbi:MAG: hypothetical protein AAGG81_04310 [Chlamydiota bacterium]
MAKEEPLDEALYELKSIINMLQANLFKMVNTSEVVQTEKLLQDMKKSINEFKKKALKELEDVGLTREQKDTIAQGEIPKDVKGEYRETLKIAIDLKNKIEEMRNIAHKEQGVFDDEPQEEKDKVKKKKDKPISKSQHKKKYKRLGGDNWKPL